MRELCGKNYRLKSVRELCVVSDVFCQTCLDADIGIKSGFSTRPDVLDAKRGQETWAQLDGHLLKASFWRGLRTCFRAVCVSKSFASHF